MPQYDASGNQTLIKTSTGVWTAVYNAVNRPVSFTSQDGSTVLECGYNYQGRRYMKKVTENGRSPAIIAQQFQSLIATNIRVGWERHVPLETSFSF